MLNKKIIEKDTKNNDLRKLLDSIRCNTADARIIQESVEYLPVTEQECHFNIDREDECIYVCCSYGKFITKLTRVGLFMVSEILVNDDNRILQIKGTLPLNGITIRWCGK